MIDFTTPIKALNVSVGARLTATLRRRSVYELDYLPGARAAVSLLMPLEDGAFRDGDLFAVMDMNLPEGFLLAQLRERSPKAPPTRMQLLALMGANGIGRLGYSVEGAARDKPPGNINRHTLLRLGAGRGGRVFRELVDAWLSTGSGLAGVQPKILLRERASIPAPNLLVKTAGPEYPGLAANEFLCLEVARRAGLRVPRHELSDDGALLLIDRFDLRGATRLGFEDIAALMDLRVGGALSDRKYRGSYEAIARLLRVVCTRSAQALRDFFSQLALSVLVRNGDAHLKNFAVLYDSTRCWLSPLYDVVTTSIYPYQRGEVLVRDDTMALKLLARGDRRYPLPDELLDFGRAHCGLADARPVMRRLLAAMSETLVDADGDERIPRATLKAMRREWEASMRFWTVSL